MVCPSCLNKTMNFLKFYINHSDIIFKLPNEIPAIVEIKEKEAEKNEEEKLNFALGKRKWVNNCPCKQEIDYIFERPLFLKENWFDCLCNCEECMHFYKKNEVEKRNKTKDENVSNYLLCYFFIQKKLKKER